MKKTLMVLLTLLFGPLGFAQEAATTFRQSCMSCHTIGGGRLVGPDLKDVTKRRDRQWVADFIYNPKKYLDSNDPYVLNLKEEARGAIMPQIAGVTPEKAAALVDLIESESALEISQFVGLSMSDVPFTATDVRKGFELFAGIRPLANGGASCISCHSAAGLPRLGGGQLGPDLTKVFERMQGRKTLASWLQAPATPTMQALFAGHPITNDELVPLVAYLEDAAAKGGRAEAPDRVAFLLLGFVGTAIGFAGADVIWRRRLRGVRRSLVGGKKK
ncbi:MAG: cytochrome c [Acidobacteria bacterium]|nr:cytochrome c [Acidobacteriota bacterium]